MDKDTKDLLGDCFGMLDRMMKLGESNERLADSLPNRDRPSLTTEFYVVHRLEEINQQIPNTSGNERWALEDEKKRLEKKLGL